MNALHSEVRRGAVGVSTWACVFVANVLFLYGLYWVLGGFCWGALFMLGAVPWGAAGGALLFVAIRMDAFE